MDATLMFSASSLLSNTPSGAANNAPVSGAQPVSGTDTTQTNTPQGRIFAGLMRDLLPTHERQDVAAAATSDPSSLKSENLGGQLEVITASSDQPDAGSLSAFARAQGLDESAVMALFGEKFPATPVVVFITTTPAATDAATAADMGANALNAALLSAQASEANELQTSGCIEPHGFVEHGCVKNPLCCPTQNRCCGPSRCGHRRRSNLGRHRYLSVGTRSGCRNHGPSEGTGHSS